MDITVMSFIDLLRQLSILISLPAVIVAGGAAAVIVVARDWRLALFAYALLSVILALLLAQAVPPEWALLQAIVGGLNAIMLYLSAGQLRGAQRGLSWAGRAVRGFAWPQMASLSSFRLLTVALAGVTFFIVRDNLQLPLLRPLWRDAFFWLMLMGALGLALHEEPLHAGLALLTILGGFLLLFYTLTQQRMLVGLMEGWQLLLGLVIAYLTLARGLPSDSLRPASGPGSPSGNRTEASHAGRGPSIALRTGATGDDVTQAAGLRQPCPSKIPVRGRQSGGLEPKAPFRALQGYFQDRSRRACPEPVEGPPLGLLMPGAPPRRMKMSSLRQAQGDG
jgi:hypothetical protein